MNWIEVGRVQDAHGLKGHLYIRFFSNHSLNSSGLKANWFNDLEEVYLKVNPKSQNIINAPEKHEKLKEHQGVYKVLSKSFFKEGIKVQFENIDDRTKAENLRGLLFCVSKDLLKNNIQDDQSLYKDILGFKIYDKDEFIGLVKELGFNGAQDLIIIENENEKYEVPYVEAFVLELNIQEKKISMKLPEGILDI